MEETFRWFFSRQGHCPRENVMSSVVNLTQVIITRTKLINGCFSVSAAVLKLSSLTLLSESVPEFNSSRTERRLQHSFPMMVVWTTSKKTLVLNFSILKNISYCFDNLILKSCICVWYRMKFWSLDLDERVMQWEIFPELGSRWWRYPVFLYWPFSRRRRRNQDLKLSEVYLTIVLFLICFSKSSNVGFVLDLCLQRADNWFPFCTLVFVNTIYLDHLFCLL